MISTRYEGDGGGVPRQEDLFNVALTRRRTCHSGLAHSAPQILSGCVRRESYEMYIERSVGLDIGGTVCKGLISSSILSS